ncbi:MAG: YqgE/AlgH family protein [Proteobacteria bacterium]|nr:YqgE/AlgH family protein [Pseudomonadota bacterium]
MTDATYLAGRLLLAMPGMGDPRFDHAVIAMIQHDADGALGLGIGHEVDDLTLHTVLADQGIDPGAAPDVPVLYGGPVETQRGFVLHSADWQGRGTIHAGALGAMSMSRDVLEAIAAGTGPGRFVVVLGYAGWGAGQLDGEMRRHGWFAAQGRAGIVYDTVADDRWKAAWRAEGIDPALLASETGRA